MEHRNSDIFTINFATSFRTAAVEFCSQKGKKNDRKIDVLGSFSGQLVCVGLGTVKAVVVHKRELWAQKQHKKKKLGYLKI